VLGSLVCRVCRKMSQLSDWNVVHREPLVFWEDTQQPVEREGANAGQHTPTLFLLPPSHHCLNGEVYRGNRHYNHFNVCEHEGLGANRTTLVATYAVPLVLYKNDLKYKHSGACTRAGAFGKLVGIFFLVR
jgi:hypothetical protein